MPGAGYFGRIAGAAALGFFTLVVAFLIFVFLLPYLIPLALGTFLLLAIFLVIWGVTFVSAFVGVVIYYFFRPMKVSKQDKGYSIEKSKESGKREKGGK